MKKKVSIIIRTKNEEKWISHCLGAVFGQEFRDFEVILVDNESQDKTIEKAKQFDVAGIISCKDFLPGKALNMGIRASAGDYLVCLSGHCIPVDNKWLGNLLRNVDGEKDVAGVYGRQEPMDFTPNSDKRDLAVIFGLDRKVQVKDTFFHNANSMIRRDVWEKVPFDETVTNIEDRVWAKEVLAKGYKIIYEPDASVYHYHGIHQDGDPDRCASVIRVMENINGGNGYKSIDLSKMNVVAIVPVRGEVPKLGGRPILEYTVKRARESKYVKKVIVSTDNAASADTAVKLGAEAPFLRDPSFSGEHVRIDQVLRHSLEKIEASGIYPDLIVLLEMTFPFRPKGLIDDMILELGKEGLDSIVAVKPENRAIWKEAGGSITLLNEGLTPRKFKDPTFIELRGVATVTHPASARGGDLLGGKIGIYQIDDPYCHIEVRGKEDFAMASALMKGWKL